MSKAIKEAKADLRREMKRRAAELSAEQRVVQSEQICEQILQIPNLGEAGTVLVFASLPDEPNLDSLWSSAVPWALPQVVGKELRIWRVSALNQLQRGVLGIREPNPELCERIDPAEITTILVPGLAFDRKSGRRLGRGGGFYDRFLADSQASKIGIGFAHQVVDGVPFETHDCCVDRVISGSDHTEKL
tara:strand:+ start:27687 stop:28253 length:567 start_codon:yes stop_codon:yes gene_type:complete